MEKGKIIQVSGPVIDVLFEKGNLPHIKDALKVDNHGKECVMEVAKHMGHNVVRCIMLSASEGLCRDMELSRPDRELLFQSERRPLAVSSTFSVRP